MPPIPSEGPVVILGAGGPAGLHLARLMIERGRRVRVVGRSEDKLLRVFTGLGVEPFVADLTDPAAAAEALRDHPLAFDCVGTPMDALEDHPKTARAIADAAGRTGARIVHVSSSWSYLPVRARDLPLNETHPRQRGPKPARLRREAEDILQEAGACIAHLPDFYGPGVHASTAQKALREALDRRRIGWIGRRHCPRPYAYLPDAMRIVADLSARPEAYGQRWLIPGNGDLTARDISWLCERNIGLAVAVQTFGRATLTVAAPFDRTLRGFLPLVPHYMRPLSFDTSKLEGLLGPQRLTPHEQAVKATLTWLAEQK